MVKAMERGGGGGYGEEGVLLSQTKFPICGSSQAEVCVERGMIYQKQRDYRRASIEFEMATRLVANMSQAWNMLGLCLTSQGDVTEGVKAYKEAIRLSPQLREAWMNMGQVFKEVRPLPTPPSIFS